MQAKLGLIEKYDAFEIVTGKLVEILTTEIANQVSLAAAKGEDPNLWDLRVYTQRANPMENWLTQTHIGADALLPIVNVSFDSSTFSMNQGNVVKAQQVDGSFIIDCMAAGTSSEKEVGHITSDEVAALKAARAVRLVRNILMSSFYTYLDLKPLVSQRWVESIASFSNADESTKSIHVGRLTLKVKYLEVSPQYEGELLELLNVDVERLSDDKLLAELDYDYTKQGN